MPQDISPLDESAATIYEAEPHAITPVSDYQRYQDEPVNRADLITTCGVDEPVLMQAATPVKSLEVDAIKESQNGHPSQEVLITGTKAGGKESSDRGAVAEMIKPNILQDESNHAMSQSAAKANPKDQFFSASSFVFKNHILSHILIYIYFR
jgi:hypothetical protein